MRHLLLDHVCWAPPTDAFVTLVEDVVLRGSASTSCLVLGLTYAKSVQPCSCSMAGYPPALAASKKLAAAHLLDGGAPGKVGGPPGDAFELVYLGVRDRVWANLYKVDPVLSEYIRYVHSSGDVWCLPMGFAQPYTFTEST